MRSFDLLMMKKFLEKEDVERIVTYVGKKNRIFRVREGLVHFVYKIEGETGTVFLKIRGKNFSGIPRIETDPGLIRNEAKAIRLYSSYFPDIFPQILLYNKQKNYLLLTDISRGKVCFEKRLNARQANEEDFSFLGRKMGLVHRLTKQIVKSIRKDGDNEFREKQMLYLLGFLNHPKLNEVIERYRRTSSHLILGDPSPKNIYLEGGYLGICDLEHAHQGYYTFELAHLIAHTIVHNLTNPKVEKFSTELIKGYLKEGGLEIHKDLLPYTVVGLVLYRLVSPVVPYNLPIDISGKKTFASFFKTMLRTKELKLEGIFEILERKK